MENYSDITIKWATLNWEIEQSYALRRRVFCHEQGLFENEDIDPIDVRAQTLVALANHGGWHDRVIGTVRIHRDPDFTWWGSRLAVDESFRYSSGVGAYLIKLAVSSANAVGCWRFKANVQAQNEKLFKKIGWRTKKHMIMNGHPHCEMHAILSRFPACYQPKSGFVIPFNMIKKKVSNVDLAPALLSTYEHYQTEVAA